MDPRLMANALMPRQSDQLMDNWYQQNKLMEQTPPWQQNHGILSAPQPRPQDWHNRSGVTDYVANAINPAMIGYGAGQMAGDARNALLEGHYGEAGGLGILAAMGVMPGAKARPARSLDNLGYYSGALEAAKGLKQAKGTPEQMMAMLQKSGAKAGEIEAAGLGKFLEGRPSVTRDEIVQHLDGNRIGLNEVQYGRSIDPEVEIKMTADDLMTSIQPGEYDRNAFHYGGRDYPTWDDAVAAVWRDAREIGPSDETKWSNYSLDPSNPTYRETVLHLPPASERFATVRDGLAAPQTQAEILNNLDAYVGLIRERDAQRDFTSGHFGEPNIVGHMMTSMAKHEGKPVYLIDQIQSDWGQKLRDGGVRDEAKIADLTARRDAAWREADPILDRYMRSLPTDDRARSYKPDAVDRLTRLGREGDAMAQQWVAARDRANLLSAELRTAEAATPGHPLVNTTDQWTNTTLRRAIQQAADSDAQGLAIPHGDTVLSYNPGDDAGMRGFYGSRVQEGIVPKNLRKLLSSADPAYPGPSRIETLETSAGPRGWNALESNPFDQSQTGFTYFPLTDAARAKIKEGLPLFSAAGLGILGAPAGMNALYGGDNR